MIDLKEYDVRVSQVDNVPIKNSLPDSIRDYFKTEKQWLEYGKKIKEGSVPYVMHPSVAHRQTSSYYLKEQTYDTPDECCATCTYRGPGRKCIVAGGYVNLSARCSEYDKKGEKKNRTTTCTDCWHKNGMECNYYGIQVDDEPGPYCVNYKNIKDVPLSKRANTCTDCKHGNEKKCNFFGIYRTYDIGPWCAHYEKNKIKEQARGTKMEKKSIKRKNEGFREKISKNGTFSPHLGKKVSERLTEYCRASNINRTAFVNQCVSEKLDVLETEMYMQMTKEQLIELLQSRNKK